MKHIDKETFTEIHTATEDLILGNTELAYKRLNKIIGDDEINSSLCCSDISEQSLVDKGFVKNERFYTDNLKYYEKGEIVLEQSLISKVFSKEDSKNNLWDLRKKFDEENSMFIDSVGTWGDVEQYFTL